MLDATPLLRLYARRRLRQLAAEDASQAQEVQLRRLVATARETRFGRDHEFAKITSVADFQSAVPLRAYDDLWGAYLSHDYPRLVDCTWPGTIRFFAETSGTTTGKTKNIPFSHEMYRAYRKAGLDILVHHIHNRPQSRLFGGRNFMLGGSTGLRELAPGIRSGDVSGIAACLMPWWARLRYFPPAEIEAVSDWEERLEALARAAIGVDIRSISGTPSWLLILFDRLTELRPDLGRRLVDFFPGLELVIHGAVNFSPYREIFAEHLAGSRAETREVYVASEGFVAIADRGDGEGMRMSVDNGLFYEFVPAEQLGAESPTRHWLGNAETGVDYALVLSTCAGLWGHVIGDTVRLVDRDPPRLLVTGRTSSTLSAFGEHLIDAEIEEAISAAAAAIGTPVREYSVGPVFPDASEPRGGHLFIVEFDDCVPDAADTERFAATLDSELQETSDDYRAHRVGMVGPRVHVAAAGTFYAWMKRRGQLGGQHKVPRVINDLELFDDLKRFASAVDKRY